MTALLTIAGVITMLLLLSSGIAAGARVTESQGRPRGSWGIVDFTWNRARPLNPHELRWQTAMISGKSASARWPDLVAQIQALEQLSGTPPIGPVPDRHNASWIEASLTNLEAAIAAKTLTGDVTP